MFGNFGVKIAIERWKLIYTEKVGNFISFIIFEEMPELRITQKTKSFISRYICYLLLKFMQSFCLNQLPFESCHGPKVREVSSQVRCVQKRDERWIVCKCAMTLFQPLSWFIITSVAQVYERLPKCSRWICSMSFSVLGKMSIKQKKPCFPWLMTELLCVFWNTWCHFVQIQYRSKKVRMLSLQRRTCHRFRWPIASLHYSECLE